MKSADKSESGIFGLRGELYDGVLSPLGDVSEVLNDQKGVRNSVAVGAPISVSRIRIGLVFATLVLAVFACRSAYLQVYEGAHYREIANQNRIRIHEIPSHRGIIVDRNGIVLAQNYPSFRLVAYASSLPDGEELKVLLTKLSQELSLDEGRLEAEIAQAGDAEEILLAEDLPYDLSMAYMARENQPSALKIELDERRGYVTSAIPSLSHVLGYSGPLSPDDYEALRSEGYRPFDDIGQQGVEAAHEQELRGTYGEDDVEVNAKGKVLRTVSERVPVDGKNLTLTIDARLQAEIELVLEKHLKGRKVQHGAVVALDPNNGEVLAMVSYPSFDANLFAKGISVEKYQALVNDPNAPLFPRATSGEYPSGSTIKPFFAAAALTEGIITPQTTFLSTGGLKLGDHFFPDWRAGGHGVTNVYHAIADSVNTFFYMIGGGNETFKGLGVKKLIEYAQLFGLGEKSGIDITGESAGFLPSPEWKEEVKGESWFLGDTYNVAIGQGDVLVTPLQMARGTAAIANGGLLVEPHVVKDEEHTEKRIITEEVANVVRDAMRQTVLNGTARSLQELPVSSGAKTGTAQWNMNKTPHSWFTAFAPFDHPAITIAVIVEEGGDLTLAAPVGKDILEWYLTNEK